MESLPIEEYSTYTSDLTENGIPDEDREVIATKLTLKPRAGVKIGGAYLVDSTETLVGLYELSHYVPAHNHTYYVYYFLTAPPLGLLRITPLKLCISDSRLSEILSYCRGVHEENSKALGGVDG